MDFQKETNKLIDNINECPSGIGGTFCNDYDVEASIDNEDSLSKGTEIYNIELSCTNTGTPMLNITGDEEDVKGQIVNFLNS